MDQDKLYSMGVIGGDYDRDGDVDIYVANGHRAQLPLSEPR